MGINNMHKFNIIPGCPMDEHGVDVGGFKDDLISEIHQDGFIYEIQYEPTSLR